MTIQESGLSELNDLEKNRNQVEKGFQKTKKLAKSCDLTVRRQIS